MPYKVDMSPRTAKVPLYGNVARAVTITLGATVGAQIGVDLLMPDGSIATTAKLAKLFGATSSSSSGSSIDTTDDVDEGSYHFYFTDLRAQDAVGGILADTTTIDLAYASGTSITATLKDLVDSGTGAALVKITRDAKGRLSGTEAATTTDLAEGSNLYFTDERAQDAVGSALDSTGNVPLTYDDAGNKISAALSTGVLASLALADSATQPGDLATVATSGAYADLSGLPTLGTAAATAATDYATAAQGALADSALQDAPSDGTTYGRKDGAWTATSGGIGSGDVVGPASSTDSAIALFDGVTGKLLKDGGALDKTAVGLGNVDNTSDVNKPVSTAQQIAMNALSFKNRLINGDFAINQRAFAGGALAAGVYGFDRWKAGTGGCNVSLSGGVLTHTSGPLVQVMEAPGLASTTVTVSVEDPSGSVGVDVDGVTGTITAGAGRRGVSIAVPSSSTGNVTLTLTATGVTYKRAQLEIGAIATGWDQRHVGTEMALCMRYFFAVNGALGTLFLFSGFATSATTALIVAAFSVPMRSAPSCTSSTGILAQVVGTARAITLTGTALGAMGGNVSFSVTGAAAGDPLCLRLSNASTFLWFDAEL